MIPEGTSPEAIVLALMGVSFAFCLLVVGYFWYRYPETFARFFERLNAQSVNHSQNDIMSREQVARADTQLVPPVPSTGTQQGKAEAPRNLTEDQVLAILASARNARGKYLYSGKKIYALVGGNYGEFLAKMRALRGDEKDELPEEPTIFTPIAGRPTKASYYNDADLEYQSPPS